MDNELKGIVDRGVHLAKEGKIEEALSIFVKAIDRFGNSSVPALQEQVARALVNKGVALGTMDKPKEAIAVYDAVADRFGDSTVPELQEKVADALVNKGVALRAMDKPKEAIAVYDAVADRFGDSPVTELQEQVAKALLNKGVALGAMDKPKEAIAVYDAVADRFGDSTVPALQKKVAKALVNKGVALRAMHKLKEAIAVYDAVADRFGDSPMTELQEQVAKALSYKSLIYRELDFPDKAVETIDRLLKYYVNKKLVGDDKQRQRALLLKSIILRERGDAPEANEAFEQAADIIPESSLIQEEKAMRRHEEVANELSSLLRNFSPDKHREFKEKMNAQAQRTSAFLQRQSNFSPDKSILLVLREWNSYTPIIPNVREVDRGGGYFIRHNQKGIVIDPGYNFIENFWRAGGRLHDIDAIVCTHAHDDHTADFEAILTLLHQYNKNSKLEKKKVHLCLSLGAQRKLSGFFSLYNDSRIGRIITLNPCHDCQIQQIQLFHDILLTVLPAYHDDAVTMDGSVGLCFSFQWASNPDQEKRHVIITGDTGLYPKKVQKTNGGESQSESLLDLEKPEMSIDKRYAEILKALDIQEIDFFIPHLGSIKEYELEIPTYNPDEPLFYPNHLGLRGLAILMDGVPFYVGIISEFGEELKEIRCDIATTVQKALHGNKKMIIPGDTTLVCDIEKRMMLCHRTRDFQIPEDLEVIDDTVDTVDKGNLHIYLIPNDESNKSRLSESLKTYHQELNDRDLPYFRKQ